MSAADCIRAIQAAGRGALTDDDVLAIAEEVQRRQKRIRDRGAVPDVDAALRQATGDMAEQLRIKAALDRRHAALMADARDRVESQVRRHIAAGMRPDKAILTVLEGTTKATAAGRQSVGATKLAYEARYLGTMLDGLAKEVPEFKARKGDPTFEGNIVREMFELREGGQPGRTGDKAAAKVARIFAATAELSRQDLNRLGSYIGKLDGWAGPQAHDPYKLAKVTEAEWVAKVASRLDLERTFPDLGGDLDAIQNALGEVYRTIVTGEGRQRSARGKGEVVGPASLARGLVKHRVLHFKGPDDWLSYANDFGRGGIVDGMVGHLRHAAGVAGQMHVLGPNPEALLEGLVETLRKEARADRTLAPKKAEKIVNALDTEGTAIGSAISVMTGANMAPVDMSLAKFGSGLRAIESMSKLGGAVISSVSDLVTGAANMKLNGKPLFASYSDQFHNLLAGRDRAEAREIGRLIGEGFDGMIDHISSAAVGWDAGPGAIAKAQSLFFKASGLTWWTDTMRASQARMLSAWYGAHADRAHADLPEPLRRTLDRHGLGAAEWDAFRQTAWAHPESGTRYLTPDRMGQVADAALAPFTQKRLGELDQMIAAERQGTATAAERERGYIAGRVAKFGERIAAAEERIKARQEGVAGRMLDKTAALQDRMDLLRAMKEGAEVRADIEGAMQGIADQGQMRRFLDAVETGRNASEVATGTDRAVARQARQQFGKGERLGERVGNIDRRVTELREKMRKAGKEATGEANDLAEKLDTLIADQTEDLMDFVARSQDRLARREARLADIAAALPKRRATVIQNARLDAEIAWRRFFADEVGFGVLEADAATQRITQGSSLRGTPWGEARRFMMQFKGYPIAYAQRVLGRQFNEAAASWHAGERMQAVGNLSHLIVMTTVAGYMAQTAKDYIKGYEPRDPTKIKTILSAMKQGGGMGIYGDFLFGEANRFGGGILETIAGPAIGDVTSIANMAMRARDGDVKAGEALNKVLQMTPGASLWYARPAMDLLVLNGLRDSLSPGFLARQDAKRFKDYGQQRAFGPTLF